jgi:hypothetical protein
MLGVRPTRFLRHHYRAALVWAAIPLAVFNGRTVVGCGCFGHFESVCHCGCCSGTKAGANKCCTGHGFNQSGRSCCNKSASTIHCNTAAGNSRLACGQSLQGPRCTSIVLHEVTPVTVAPNANAGDLHESIFALADVGLPLVFSQSQVGQVVDFHTGPPPNDLVITLHRLVI